MEAKTDVKYEELNKAIEELGLEHRAEFVPFSQSRSAKEKHPSLNRKVKLFKRSVLQIETDYMQGIAHAPGYNDKATKNGKEVIKGSRGWKEQYFRVVAEKGKYISNFKRLGEYRDWYWAAEDLEKGYGLGLSALQPVPPPHLRDVMYSLLMDSSVLNASSFEDWASEFGMDTDSRKAEAMYRACLDIALKMRAVLGESGMTLLRELYDKAQY